MTNILAAIIGVLASAATALVTPLAEWHLVDRYKVRREIRREKLEKWRTMVRDVWRNCRILEEIREEKNQDGGGNSERVRELEERLDVRYQNLELGLPAQALKSDERFYSLRPHLSKETTEEVENTAGTTGKIIAPDLIESITQDIDRIESEWGLS
jgi:hypothetical protein